MSALPPIDPRLGELSEPVKNRFFYGMLLNEHALTREQRYFEDKHRVVTRFGLGIGVLAGLRYQARDGAAALSQLSEADLAAAPPPDPVTHLRLTPGVALDVLGREVVVPSTLCGNDLIYEIGVPDPADGTGTVAPAEWDRFIAAVNAQFSVALTAANPCYLVLEIRCEATEVEPVPVRAGTCATACQNSAVKEGFRLRFRPSAHPDALSGSDDGPMTAFPAEPPEDVRHRELAQGIPGLAASAVLHRIKADRTWVPLGVFRCDPPADRTRPGTVVHVGRSRQVFSTDALSRLVFALAERVDVASRLRILTYAETEGRAGEGQTAEVNQVLGTPLAVRVVDGSGQSPRFNRDSVRVQFDVLTTDGGQLFKEKPFIGAPDDAPLPIDDAGAVSVWWKLGATPGLHTVAARIVPANPAAPPFHPGSQLVFHATATAVVAPPPLPPLPPPAVPPTPPVIAAMTFPSVGHSSGLGSSRVSLRIVFTQRMERNALKNPAPWLKVWMMAGPFEEPRHNGTWIENHHPFGPIALVPHLLDVVELGSPGDPDACQSAEFWLNGLADAVAAGHHKLFDGQPVRFLAMIRPDNGLVSAEAPHTALDPAFDGSSLPARERDRLWTAQQAPPHPGTADLIPWWDVFAPRERSLPSGAGAAGGEFHKTFDLRYHSR